MPEGSSTAAKYHRAFHDGYQEALSDLVNTAIEHPADPVSALLDWIKNNARNEEIRERAERVAVWSQA